MGLPTLSVPWLTFCRILKIPTITPWSAKSWLHRWKSHCIMSIQSLNFWPERIKVCSSFYGSDSSFFFYSIVIYVRSSTTRMITESSNLKTGKHWWVALTIIVSPLLIFNYNEIVWQFWPTILLKQNFHTLKFEPIFSTKIFTLFVITLELKSHLSKGLPNIYSISMFYPTVLSWHVKFYWIWLLILFHYSFPVHKCVSYSASLKNLFISAFSLSVVV